MSSSHRTLLSASRNSSTTPSSRSTTRSSTPLGCRDYHLQSPQAQRSQSPSTRSYTSISSSSDRAQVASTEVPVSCRDSLKARYDVGAPIFGGKDGEAKVLGCRDYKMIRA